MSHRGRHSTAENTNEEPSSKTLIPQPHVEVEPLPHGWPKYPQPVRREPVWFVCETVIDILLAAASLLFLAFAILARVHDGVHVEDRPRLVDNLVTATTYGPTVFPILFAAVMGRATKACILWRLESGEKLGTLDVLSAGTTFASAIFSQISIRHFSIVGCVLACIWAFSPAGGQASLRMVGTVSETLAQSQTLRYMSAESQYDGWGAEDLGSSVTVATGLYVAVLLSPASVKSSPMDLWRNVKVPMMETLPGWSAEQRDSDAWLGVPIDQQVTYSSLVGVPVAGLEAGVAQNFSIETAYWTLDCPKFGEFDLLSDHNCTTNLTNGITVEPQNCFGPSTYPWIGALGTSSMMFSNDSERGRSAMLTNDTTCPRHRDDTTISPRNLIYEAWPLRGGYRFSAQCTISTSWVEMDVLCRGHECSVPRMRPSQQAHPAPGWSFLDDNGCTNFQFFSVWFTDALDSTTGATGSLPQGYLANPDDPTLAREGADPPNPGDVDAGVFAQRLAQLLNTFWTISVGISVVNSGVLLSDQQLAGDSVSSYLRSHSSDGTATHEITVLRYREQWFAVLIVVSTFLFFASMVPLAARSWSRIPGLALTPSTMLRDNGFVAIPSTGSTLSSAERSRLLRHERVRFGDLASTDAIGHLGIGSVPEGDADEARFSRVRKGRLYD